MKVRRLRKSVITVIYSFTLFAVLLSAIFFGKALKSMKGKDIDSYVVNPLVEEEQTPVMNYTSDQIIKPYNAEDVVISKNFYDNNADEENQQHSLIYYENTYMQNTGILYSSENTFDVIAVLDGKVTEVKDDDILGKIVVIEHDDNIKTLYQSIADVKVKVGDEVKQSDIIATSGSNQLNNTSQNCLLFEVHKDGKIINPEEFYKMNLKASQ